MSLAGGRAPRRTAGNRLAGLLNAEEDEFYQTTYGGFTEESGDDEYKGDQSDSDDEVDSDFDIDEGDEPASDQDDDEPKRKRRVVTKAYKEPIKSLRPKKPDTAASSSQKVREEKSAPLELQDEVGDSRKYMRQSTTEHTRQTFLRVQERQVQSKRKKGGTNYDRPLTQEELLEEAKITEEINLRSLETYERLEADKRKHVQKKRKCVGPVIRYYSGTMPLITDLGVKEENVDVEGLDQDMQQTAEAPQAAASPAGKCSRTFITFSDDETFERFFPKAKQPKLPVKEICPVTHKPAVYRDPITDIPYSNIRAFKIIREAYKKYITAHGLPNAAASAALGAGPPATDPNVRATRQKIIIKQTVPAT
ncbi:vacuolar protein sorting-associated protein 72 homolog [Trachemys scripta elegans]|uniref:vacuolar protein sorting-associated protein 72 homolog n=1 Tax=Trachemys scripta elegans TaxID=31138 RepID=UPI0015531859|nr:vacuolar protein sorting-associated protein 72 homolog [Trachemys scripta elegans]XP_053867239.1 vacuolar protein sorting-associated protein 72 homolog [Malaclemys terrapin pileata]